MYVRINPFQFDPSREQDIRRLFEERIDIHERSLK
jgi:hypothetical protein